VELVLEDEVEVEEDLGQVSVEVVEEVQEAVELLDLEKDSLVDQED